MNQSVLPEWVEDLTKKIIPGASKEELLSIAVDIATGSARNSGGPFGALLVDESGVLVSVGWNSVVTACDSTAHAEIACIRGAQQTLQTHNLSPQSTGQTLKLYSSGAPCIQCFGAIYWSGLQEVWTAAAIEDAEATGFDEGPVSKELWADAHSRKGVIYGTVSLPGKNVKEPFDVFTENGGVLY